MIFRRGGGSSRLFTPRRIEDLSGKVGDPLDSSVVAAPVQWIARTLPEAPIIVADKDGATLPVHPMTDLLHRPNPYYPGALLWSATVIDLLVGGNAYWVKIRNRAGAIVQIWWVPSPLMEVRSDDERFISGYIYRPGFGAEVPLEETEVVHLRHGLDPSDPRLGASPLRSLLSEVFTDKECGSFTSSLLANMGVPGLIISPADGDREPSADDMKATRDYLDEQVTGDRRGKPLVMSGPTTVKQFGFSPQAMNVSALRQVSEERVSAVLGVPAIVCGLGAGLARSTFANFAEAREAAYESCLIPLQELLAVQLDTQLLADVDATPGRRVAWDRSSVRVLQADRMVEAQRAALLATANIITRAQALEMLGEPTRPGDDIYIGRQMAMPGDPLDAAPPPPKMLTRGTKISRAQATMRRGLAADVAAIEREFAPKLRREFDAIAEQVAEHYAATAEAKSNGNGSVALKVADEQTTRTAEAILASVALAASATAVARIIGDLAERTRRATAKRLDHDLPERLLTAARANGIMRAGLLDITGDTRIALTSVLDEAIRDGVGIDETAKRIRDLVGRGRYTTAGADYRARLIARTETAVAQRASVLAIAADRGETHVYIWDGVEHDEECANRDGTTVTLAEAREMEATAHPNCSLTLLVADRAVAATV